MGTHEWEEDTLKKKANVNSKYLIESMLNMPHKSLVITVFLDGCQSDVGFVWKIDHIFSFPKSVAAAVNNAARATLVERNCKGILGKWGAISCPLSNLSHQSKSSAETAG